MIAYVECIVLLSYRRRYKYSVAVFKCAVQHVALCCVFRLTRGLILASLQAATRHRTPREGVSPLSHCLERQRSACMLAEGSGTGLFQPHAGNFFWGGKLL